MLAIATDVASWLVCTCESGTPVSRAKTVRPIEMMQFNGILVLATFLDSGSVRVAEKGAGESVKFCRLGPKGPLPGVGFLRKGPPARGSGERCKLTQWDPLQSPGRSTISSVLYGFQAPYSATLLRVTSCRSPLV